MHSRSGLEYALCTIRSHGTELIMLGRNLHSGTSKNKATRTSPTRLSFVLKLPLCNMLPRVINFVPCDWIYKGPIAGYFWPTVNRPVAGSGHMNL